jgi:hypothetical protein
LRTRSDHFAEGSKMADGACYAGGVRRHSPQSEIAKPVAAGPMLAPPDPAHRRRKKASFKLASNGGYCRKCGKTMHTQTRVLVAHVPDAHYIHCMWCGVRLAIESTCSAWLAIDSAPRDGTRILVPMRGRVTIAWWNDQKYHTKPKPFWESVDLFGILSDSENQPTYWMPLPSLPNAQSEPHGPTKNL